MNVQISKIKITNRIRKEIAKIAELSADIQANGLINPITVMPLEGGEHEYQLIAGLRRLRATEMNGDSDIAIHLVSPANAEEALRMEISENEQREEFTFTEKMDFARMLEEIEKAKAKERQTEGQLLGGAIAGKGRPLDDSLRDHGPASYEPPKNTGKRTRDIVGEKIGMSGKQYDRAKYIAENASDEVIDELDKGERSIRGTYDELKADEKAKKSESVPDESKPEAPAPAGKAKSSKASTAPTKSPDDYLTDADRAAIERSEAFAAMSPDEKVAELKRQLSEQRQRAHAAESQLSRLKELRHNDNYHKDGIIENLKGQVARLEKELEAAEARIVELEALRCPSDDAKE